MDVVLDLFAGSVTSASSVLTTTFARIAFLPPGYAPNTIVVMHSVGAVLMEPWIEDPHVTAALWAGRPGQEAGNALVDVLWGAVNPSARLPFTIAKREEDYPAKLNLGPNGKKNILQIPYTEGYVSLWRRDGTLTRTRLNIDYKRFDAVCRFI